MTNDFKLLPRKIGSGYYRITLFDNNKLENVNTFTTNDAELFDDICSHNEGLSLDYFDSFDELLDYCKIKTN